MDFSLTPEQQMFREMFQDFAANEVATLAELTDRQEELPAKLLKKAAAQGFLGALAPEEPYGGAGLDTISYTLLMQELAAECMSTALVIHVHNSLAMRAILGNGSQALKDELIPDMVAGARIGAFALTEATAGSDPSRLRTCAVRDGDAWVLNGAKTWVSNGGIAGVFVVFAVTDPAAGVKGISAFALPKETPGLKIGGREKTLGIRGAVITRVYLDDCRAPAANLLGAPGQGYRIAMETLDYGRVILAAGAVGMAKRALDKAAQYASERVQFGGPIANKQAIQAYLADMAVDIAAGEGLVHKASWLIDQGKPYTQEAAMAKLFTSRMAREVTNQAVQIYGGAGYIVDSGMERYYRDARAFELVEGTSQIQQIIIAGGILAEHGIKVRP